MIGEQRFGIDQAACQEIATSIQEVYALGVQIGLVIGGGNIFRGNMAESFGFSRTPADHIGMLATSINGLVLQQSLARLGVKSRVMSAFTMDPIIESYHWGKAMQYLQEGLVVIFVGGTGNPYFTTDSAAALRASEIEAEVLLKGTKVDGIFSEDPIRNKEAKRFDSLTYSDVLTRNLQVMDGAAVALCRENKIPICVFNLFAKGAMVKAVCGKKTGTLVRGD